MIDANKFDLTRQEDRDEIKTNALYGLASKVHAYRHHQALLQRFAKSN
ncbi:MAG: hypothetical protein AAGB32_06185 [Pseudomonadota bacterium]